MLACEKGPPLVCNVPETKIIHCNATYKEDCVGQINVLHALISICTTIFFPQIRFSVDNNDNKHFCKYLWISCPRFNTWPIILNIIDCGFACKIKHYVVIPMLLLLLLLAFISCNHFLHFCNSTQSRNHFSFFACFFAYYASVPPFTYLPTVNYWKILKTHLTFSEQN